LKVKPKFDKDSQVKYKPFGACTITPLFSKKVNFKLLLESILKLEVLARTVEPLGIVDNDIVRPLKTSYKGLSISVKDSDIFGVSSDIKMAVLFKTFVKNKPVLRLNFIS
jgi:hypothetical protein